MKKLKKMLVGSVTGAMIVAFTAVNSLAATVNLPPEFDDVKPLIEFILKIVEFIGKIVSMFA